MSVDGAIGCFFLLFVYLLQLQGAGSLKMARVVVPRYKIRGETATLECHYELEGDTLYAVKWYKENEEFYRYVPKSEPPQRVYKVEGIRVHTEQSNSEQVLLRGVNLKSSALYRCEVSAEAPSFASAQGEGRMDVVYLPNNGPHISGEEEQYFIGSDISLNCTSGKSYPAPVLHWYINDKPVTDSRCLRYYANDVHPHGLVTSTVGLRLELSSQHFLHGSMRVRCVASVSPTLWMGDRESVVQRVQDIRLKDREALLLVRGSGSLHGSPTALVAVLLILSLLWPRQT